MRGGMRDTNQLRLDLVKSGSEMSHSASSVRRQARDSLANESESGTVGGGSGRRACAMAHACKQGYEILAQRLSGSKWSVRRPFDAKLACCRCAVRVRAESRELEEEKDTLQP